MGLWGGEDDGEGEGKWGEDRWGGVGRQTVVSHL